MRSRPRAARPLTVEVTDETGRPIAGAAVSFHLPEDGPSAMFPNGLRTEVVATDEHGRAILRSMQLNRVPGRFEVRVIASKEQATAGTVSFQYIADPAGGAAMASAGNRGTREPRGVDAGSHWHKKWILILAAAGGGAAASNPAPVPQRSGRLRLRWAGHDEVARSEGGAGASTCRARPRRFSPYR